ncbi:MAG: ABC transporter substrate-binding protein [Oscillospiraceae bacterium]|nr:ABC transporter substrate-binding protein [Oscillospiraceae bacterium]
MKKSTWRKMICALMSALFIMAMFTGCGSGGGSGSTGSGAVTNADGSLKDLDTSEEVEVVMYVVSDRPAGQDVVDENLNKILKEKLNCTMKINWIGWAEYQNKYPLLFSSGESFDLAYCATWLNFSNLARKGAFMDISELLPKYAPKNYAQQSKTALAQATVDGKLYAVPTLLATYTAYGAIYREDIAKEISPDFKIVDWNDVETYCDFVKANHPEMEPIDEYSSGPELNFTYMKNAGYHYIDGSRYLWYDPAEEHPTVKALYDYEAETADFLQMVQRFGEKGFWTKSALADTDSQKIQTGKAALRFHNIDNYAGFNVQHPEWGYGWATFTKDVAHLPYTQDALVVSNTSKHPDRALAVWDLLTSDQEAYDAYMYGVLGTTYNLNDKGQYSITDLDLYSTGACWAVRTMELNRNQDGAPEDYDTIRQGWEANIKEGVGTERFGGFVFDPTNVQTEVTACQNVFQQYWWPMELGYTTDLEEFKTQMGVAGIDKVIAEVQSQLDTYLAAQG